VHYKGLYLLTYLLKAKARAGTFCPRGRGQCAQVKDPNIPSMVGEQEYSNRLG